MANEFPINATDVRQASVLGAVRANDKVYNIRIQSPFILTQIEVKKKIGIGYRILTIEVERETSVNKIESVDDAMEMIVKTGYRALVRAKHPDLGGDPEEMVLLNRCKKELETLLKELKGV